MSKALLCLLFLISMYGNPCLRPSRLKALGNGTIMDRLIADPRLARRMFLLTRSFIHPKVMMIEALNSTLLPTLLNRLLSHQQSRFSHVIRVRMLWGISGRLIRKTFISSSGDQDTLDIVMKLLETPIPPLIVQIRWKTCVCGPTLEMIVDGLYEKMRLQSEHEDQLCPPMEGFTVTHQIFFPEYMLPSKHFLYRLLSLIKEINPSFFSSMRTSFFSQESCPQDMCVGNAKSE